MLPRRPLVVCRVITANAHLVAMIFPSVRDVIKGTSGASEVRQSPTNFSLSMLEHGGREENDKLKCVEHAGGKRQTEVCRTFCGKFRSSARNRAFENDAQWIL